MPFFRTPRGLVLFAHVPRCAGSSVENYLEARFGRLAFLDRGHYEQPAGYRWSCVSPQHLDKSSLNRLIPQDYFADSFAVVRHPVARLESVYLYHLHWTQLIPASTSFEQWVSQLEIRRERDYGYLDNHACRIVDLVPEGCRFFRLEDGLSKLEQWLDEVAGSPWPLHIEHLHRVEQLTGEAAPSPVHRTRRSVEMIFRMYRDDFNFFGYDLEPVEQDAGVTQVAFLNKSDEHTQPSNLSRDDLLVSHYLDQAHYFSQVNDASTIPDPAGHYLQFGAEMNLDPTKDFSTKFYLERSPDVAEAGINPFVHYLRWGQREGRIPHPSLLPGTPTPESDGVDVSLVRQHFDIEFYEQQAPHIADCHVDAVKHYFHFGWQQGLDPSPYFSTNFYLSHNEDVGRGGPNPFLHYLRWGKSEGRRGYENDSRAASQLEHAAQARLIERFFDTSFYCRQHIDLCSNDADPILHFLSVGWRMGLDPSEGFSTNFYVACQGDRQFEGGNPLSDYLLVGKRSGSVPSECHSVLSLTMPPEARLAEQKKMLEGVFDREFYMTTNPDLYGRVGDPLDHYLLEGWSQGRDPVAWLSVDYYLKTYPRARDYPIDPLVHFLIWGRDNGLRPSSSAMLHGENTDALIGLRSSISDSMLTSILRDHVDDRTIAPLLAYNPEALEIHWLIPGFGLGGGGHMMVFRMIHWLEYLGHRCTIWVKGIGPEQVDSSYEYILKHYQFVKAKILPLDSAIFDAQGDVLFATSWDTAQTVHECRGFKQGCYFVQDYEPYFYPRGSRSVLAEFTYELGLPCICNSSWMRHVLERNHQAWARDFHFSCDRETYFPPSELLRSNPVPRIALYGRKSTERRCVELALLALEELARRGFEFHVDIFGSAEQFQGAQIVLTNHGILNGQELGNLYRSCDLGICFSGTNASMIPPEMMGCGLPVVELDVESARWSIPDHVATFVSPDPCMMADSLQHLLCHAEARLTQAQRALEWVEQSDWQAAATRVEAALHELLSEGPWQPHDVVIQSGHDKPQNIVPALKASIIIPTLNGGTLFAQLLGRLARQKVDFAFELIVVDSGSEDQTLEASKAFPFTRVIEIDKSEFQHGRTRNLAASHAEGDYLLFLTQDAIPADEFWLYNFVSAMEMNPDVAGGFGRHYPHHSASPYTAKEINDHFNRFNAYPLRLTKHVDIVRWNSGELQYRQALHFYSDNNSCMRRSTWVEMPYPEVDFGEDQLWASYAIRRGWSTLYCPHAAVCHSHEYDYDSMYDRAEVESWFFRKYFGYDLSVPDIQSEYRLRVAAAMQYARNHGVPLAEVERKHEVSLGQLRGWEAGKRRADAEI